MPRVDSLDCPSARCAVAMSPLCTWITSCPENDSEHNGQVYLGLRIYSKNAVNTAQDQLITCTSYLFFNLFDLAFTSSGVTVVSASFHKPCGRHHSQTDPAGCNVSLLISIRMNPSLRMQFSFRIQIEAFQLDKPPIIIFISNKIADHSGQLPNEPFRLLHVSLQQKMQANASIQPHREQKYR
jgi:hypothetical protein